MTLFLSYLWNGCLHTTALWFSAYHSIYSLFLLSIHAKILNINFHLHPPLFWKLLIDLTCNNPLNITKIVTDFARRLLAFLSAFLLADIVVPWYILNKTAVRRDEYFLESNTLSKTRYIIFSLKGFTLREKGPNTEFFPVHQENRDQKKLRIWTLFTQCQFLRIHKLRGF